MFISNIEPKLTLDLVGKDKFRKSYTNRIDQIESTIAAFSLYIVLKPNSFKYQNKNFYHFKDPDKVWDVHKYTQESWPEGYMVSMAIKKNMDDYGDNLKKNSQILESVFKKSTPLLHYLIEIILVAIEAQCTVT